MKSNHIYTVEAQLQIAKVLKSDFEKMCRLKKPINKNKPRYQMWMVNAKACLGYPLDCNEFGGNLYHQLCLMLMTK